MIIGPPNVPVDKEAQYEAAARDVAEGGSRLPAATAADYKTNDGPRNNSPYKERLDHLSEKLVLAGTGGMLTMLTAATGIGKGPSEEHADVFQSIARGDARRLSGVFQRRIDRDVFARNFRGKPALAYFQIAANQETDVGDIVEHVLKLRQAGYAVDVEEVSEKTSYKVTAVAPLPINGNADPAKNTPPAPEGKDPTKEAGKLPNRAPVSGAGNPVANSVQTPAPPPGMSAADWQDVLGVRAQWLGPLQPILDRILGMAGDGSLTLERLLEQTDALVAQVPEVDLDADALADRLEANLGAATVSGLRDALAAQPPSPDA